MKKEVVSRFNILKWSAVFFSSSFGMGIALNSIGFVSFCLTSVAYSLMDHRRSNLSYKPNATIILFVMYFMFISIREVVINSSEAPEIIFYYLSLVIIPLIFLFQTERLKEYFRPIAMAFLMGMLLNAAINLGFGIYRGVLIREEGINFWYFTYHFLSEPFGIQPIYLGYFYVIALIILVRFKIIIKSSALYYFFLALLVISVFLLAARNAILCLIVLIPAYLLLAKKISLKSGAIILGVLMLCFIAALQNPVVKNRIFKITNKGNFYSGTSLRSNIWSSAWSASEENFIWGSGEKEAGTLLLKEFEARNLEIPLKHKYHAHNQFLQTLVQYGLIGIVILTGIFIVTIWTSYKEGNYFGLTIAILFLLTMMTESIFTRQWGLYSYVFFICLSVIDSNNRKNLAP